MSVLFSDGKIEGIFTIDGRMDDAQFDNLLFWASSHKASDLTFQSNNFVYGDIGGNITKLTNRALTHPEIEDIVKYIYGENGPAEIKSGYDLDPSHEVMIPYEIVNEDGVKTVSKKLMRFRVNITGIRIPRGDGIEITVRTLPELPPTFAELGIEKDIIDNFRPKNGMVIVTGPTGSGKSTLLAAGLRSLLEGENEKIIEYSSPIEYVYDKVKKTSSVIGQSEVPRHIRPKGGTNRFHANFDHCVRNALRRKPTIIVIGESRDKETINASIEASQTGHALYTTMHTIGVPETIQRALLTYPALERSGTAITMMESLRMIVTQILVEKVGGGKVACREYLVFSQDVRREFFKHEYERWPMIARKIMENKEHVVCKTMVESANDLFEKGLISEATLETITAMIKSKDLKVVDDE